MLYIKEFSKLCSSVGCDDDYFYSSINLYETYTDLYLNKNRVHHCGPGCSMRARVRTPVGTGFRGFSSPVRQMSGSFRSPRSPNIIWPSSSSLILHYGRQLPEMLTCPKILNIHTYNKNSHIHPLQKSTVLRTLLHRAIMVSDSNSLPDEISVLCTTFKQNNYNNREINKALRTINQMSNLRKIIRAGHSFLM